MRLTSLHPAPVAVLMALGVLLAAFSAVLMVAAAYMEPHAVPARGLNSTLLYMRTFIEDPQRGDLVGVTRGATIYCMVSSPADSTLYLTLEPFERGSVVEAEVKVRVGDGAVEGSRGIVVTRETVVPLAELRGGYNGYIVVTIEANVTAGVVEAVVPLKALGAALYVDEPAGRVAVRAAAIASLGAALIALAKLARRRAAAMGAGAWALHTSMALLVSALLAGAYAASQLPVAAASCVHVTHIPVGHAPPASKALANVTVPVLLESAAPGPGGIPVLLVFAAGLSAALAYGLPHESGVEEFEASLHPRRRRLYLAKAAAALTPPLLAAALSPLLAALVMGGVMIHYAIPAMAGAVAATLPPTLLASSIAALTALATRRASVAVVAIGVLILLPAGGALAALHEHLNPSVAVEEVARSLYSHTSSSDTAYNPLIDAWAAASKALGGALAPIAAALALHALAFTLNERWEE